MHQQAIYDVFEKSWIVSSVSLKKLGDITATAFGSPSIVFTDKDLPKLEYQDGPLYISVGINEHIIRGALIDMGARINIMSLHTMKNI